MQNILLWFPKTIFLSHYVLFVHATHPRSARAEIDRKVINRNGALAETIEGERTIRQSDHFLFDTNKLTNLPPGWGVLFGQHLAQACYVSPIPTEKCRAAVTPVAAEAQPDSSILAIESPRTPPAIHHGSNKSLNNDFFAME